MRKSIRLAIGMLRVGPDLMKDFSEPWDALSMSSPLSPNRIPYVLKMSAGRLSKNFHMPVYFRIDDNQIIVHSVFHEARNPANLTDF
jgi:hypothetical protein